MNSEFTVTDKVWKANWVSAFLRDDEDTSGFTISQFYYSIGIARVARTGYTHTYKIVNEKRWLLAKIRYGL